MLNLSGVKSDKAEKYTNEIKEIEGEIKKTEKEKNEIGTAVVALILSIISIIIASLSNDNVVKIILLFKE